MTFILWAIGLYLLINAVAFGAVWVLQNIGFCLFVAATGAIVWGGVAGLLRVGEMMSPHAAEIGGDVFAVGFLVFILACHGYGIYRLIDWIVETVKVKRIDRHV